MKAEQKHWHKKRHKRIKAATYADFFFDFAKVFGRGERIRTSDLSVPNRAHYQAVLRPEEVRHSKSRGR